MWPDRLCESQIRLNEQNGIWTLHEGHGNWEGFLLFRRKVSWERYIEERLRDLSKKIRTIESWSSKWDEIGSRGAWTNESSTRESQNR